MKSLSKLLAVAALIVLGLNHAWAQSPSEADKTTKVAEVKDLVGGGRYTFVATKLITQKGGSEPLNPGYDLDVSKDTVIAHLPGYTDLANGDKSLTLTHFNYQLSTSKNGSTIVTIVPSTEKTGSFREVKLDISALGYATLTVTGRKPLSCYGYIKPHSAEFPPVSAQN